MHHGTLERPQGVTVTAGAGADTTDAAATLTHRALGGGEGSVGGTVRVTVVDGDDPVAHRTAPGRTHDLPEGAKRALGRVPGEPPSAARTVTYPLTPGGTAVRSRDDRRRCAGAPGVTCRTLGADAPTLVIESSRSNPK